jgi:mutator protein MutT
MKEKICTLLFLRKGDDILLAMKKRGFGANRYNGVGGKIDSGETIEQALVRECQEEIGVTPQTYQKVAEHDFVQPHGPEPWRMYVHVYMCDSWEGEPAESEEMAPEWFKVTEIPYAQMWQDDEFWIPQVLGGDKVYGEFTFDEDGSTMLTHNVQIVDELPNRPLRMTL